MAAKEKKGLGIGLDALFAANDLQDEPEGELLTLPISKVEPREAQPRKYFDEQALQELADSIAQYGLIQPIVARKLDSGYYQIIAGERRWRASQIAGLTTIPAYVRTVEDENVMEMALVENIQREDLNAIEIALAYQHLAETTGMTQAKISERVGKSRAAVTNYMRLLKLPAQVQMALKDKEIDMGHARALLSLDSPSQQIKLFKEVQKQGYSVRKVEEMVQMLKNGQDIQNVRKTVGTKPQLPQEYNALRQHLADFFQTKVQMTCSPTGKGKISISFDSEEELERIMNVLDGKK